MKRDLDMSAATAPDAVYYGNGGRGADFSVWFLMARMGRLECGGRVGDVRLVVLGRRQEVEVLWLQHT